MASGIDDEVTLRANREGFLKFQLRPRRLVDVEKVDMSTDILGVRYATPIMIAPVGGHRMFNPEGELAVARAAKAGGHAMILSTVTTTSVEEVTAARAAPVWYQLYATNKWDVAKAFVTRAEKAGCPVVAVTVDRSGGRNQETLFRLQRTDSRDCSTCHDRSSLQANLRRRSMYEGVDVTGLTHTQASSMTWDFLKRLRDTTKMKIVLKGILAHEDATLAVQNGMDGIIVSNHGARSEDSGRSTIDALPEILDAVKGRMPVLVDSGFRRGTDIAKALCIGGAGGVRRPSLHLGTGRLRPAGRRARPGAAARRALCDHATARGAKHQAADAGDGASRVRNAERVFPAKAGIPLGWALLLLHPRGLSDLRPLIQLAADEASELGGRRAERLGTVSGQAFPGLARGERLDRFGVQMLDDARRRASGRDEAVPLHRLVARHRFGDRRDIGQRLDALRS